MPNPVYLVIDAILFLILAAWIVVGIIPALVFPLALIAYLNGFLTGALNR